MLSVFFLRLYRNLCCDHFGQRFEAVAILKKEI